MATLKECRLGFTPQQVSITYNYNDLHVLHTLCSRHVITCTTYNHMVLHASCSRRNARKPPPPQGKRGPRGRAAGPARQLAALPSRPTVTPPSHPARHCRVGRVVSSVGRPAQRDVWRPAPPSGPDLAPPFGPDLYPQGGGFGPYPRAKAVGLWLQLGAKAWL
jgi:hypothetical protein